MCQEAQEEELASPTQRSWSWLANSNNVVLTFHIYQALGLQMPTIAAAYKNRVILKCAWTCVRSTWGKIIVLISNDNTTTTNKGTYKQPPPTLRSLGTPYTAISCSPTV